MCDRKEFLTYHSAAMGNYSDEYLRSMMGIDPKASQILRARTVQNVSPVNPQISESELSGIALKRASRIAEAVLQEKRDATQAGGKVTGGVIFEGPAK